MITEKMFTDLGYEKKVLDRLETWKDNKYSIPEKQLIRSQQGPLTIYMKGNFGLVLETANQYDMAFVTLWIADIALMENICLNGLHVAMRIPCNTFTQLYLIDNLLDQWTKEVSLRTPFRQRPPVSSQNY